MMTFAINIVLFTPSQGDVGELAIPLVLMVSLGLFIGWWYWAKSRRKASFRKLAEKRGFEFVEYPEERVPEELENIPMAEDFYYICKYKINGTIGDLDISVFDLTVFEFQISKNFTYSAVTVRSDKLNLPLFTLKPRMNLEENIATSRGVQFPDDFEFTRGFRVEALDNGDARRALNAEARSVIKNDKTMSLIAKLDTLFMHKYPGNMSIKELEVCIDECVQLAGILEGA